MNFVQKNCSDDKEMDCNTPPFVFALTIHKVLELSRLSNNAELHEYLNVENSFFPLLRLIYSFVQNVKRIN